MGTYNIKTKATNIDMTIQQCKHLIEILAESGARGKKLYLNI